MEELLSLKWNNHRSTFLHILTILRDKQLYTDATLACEGRFYSVHRLVLSTCSDYFSAMFDRTNCKNPIIVLKDIKCEDLESLLDYMYLGEVNVRQADLASLIKAAECLRVKGLAVPDDEPPSKRPGPASKRSDRSDTAAASPPPKRKRRSVTAGGEESITESRQSPPPSRSQDDRRDAHSTDGDLAAVKIEPSESEGDPFALDDFKAEITDEPPPSGNDLSNDLPELLDQSGDSFSQSFAGPSSFQPDLQGWQGDQGLSSNNFSGGAFPSQSNTQNPSQDNSQNASGDSSRPESPTAILPTIANAETIANVETIGNLETTSSPTEVFVVDVNMKSEPVDVDEMETNESDLNVSGIVNDVGASSSLTDTHFLTLDNSKAEFDSWLKTKTPADSEEFVCPICNRDFHGTRRKRNLQRHMMIHTGDRPFKCNLCSYSASQKNNLTAHMTTHNNPKGTIKKESPKKDSQKSKEKSSRDSTNNSPKKI